MAEYDPNAHPVTLPVPPAADEADPAGDANIPMLTDVLHLPRYQGSELPGSLSEVDWTALTLRVRENVMERLMRRSDMMLDKSLHETLRVVLDRATETLAVELHDALSQMIRDLVARAVGDELTRVHTEITRRTRPGSERSREGSGREREDLERERTDPGHGREYPERGRENGMRADDERRREPLPGSDPGTNR